jgi:predicted nucleic acid-binding protein
LILDTNALSALADGDPKLLSTVRGVARFSLPVVVLGEFRFGISRSRYRDRYAQWLEKLVSVSNVLNVDEETANTYATLREGLRAKGHPIPSNDAWIAALALQHKLPVLTMDAHFAHVDGLRQSTW